MKNFLSFILIFTIIGSANAHFSPKPTVKKANIQVALLLDTSNSMDGLIDQAKSQLWKMVNKLASSKKDNQTPNIELALYEYGNDRLFADEGYIRHVVPLTKDLDLVVADSNLANEMRFLLHMEGLNLIL